MQIGSIYERKPWSVIIKLIINQIIKLKCGELFFNLFNGLINFNILLMGEKF